MKMVTGDVLSFILGKADRNEKFTTAVDREVTRAVDVFNSVWPGNKPALLICPELKPYKTDLVRRTVYTLGHMHFAVVDESDLYVVEEPTPRIKTVG